MITQLDIFKKDPLKLPNVVAAPNGADSISDTQNLIDIFEKEVLLDGLGRELYELLVTEYADLVNASQRIKDLVNGLEYTQNNVVVKWEGLKDYSFLPYYIFFKVLQERQDIFTTMGVERPEAVNSMAVSSIARATRVYNEFLEKYQGCNEQPIVIHATNGWGFDYQGSTNTTRSLYQFLTDKRSIYPEAEFIFHHMLNSFGI